ncbi:hypothetical protein TIFTF001_031599 [Ficus carica]|uniref:Uncharacterized protein n=1 Tax=Ficus carica TaxID=3494 RepID=A0AA88J4F1_FICCA|nr:hypothetical protein TIFTF001_031599 [Ficus carica]
MVKQLVLRILWQPSKWNQSGMAGNRVVVVVVVVVLLAATAQNRCTALVWSCYVPSRGFNNKNSEENNTNTNTNTKKEDGVMEEVVNYKKETSQGCDSTSNGNNNKSTRSGSNYGPHEYNIEPPSNYLKSNLKKTIVKENQNQNQSQSTRREKRKVSWPDAHGKDIAHIQEFEPR